MNQILVFVLGVAAGGAIGFWIAKSKFKNQNAKLGQLESKENLIEKQAEEKRQNKEAILGILETRHPLTNNHVEQLLGISDATATRYLEELEKEGKIRQVGKTGKHVYYERRNVV